MVGFFVSGGVVVTGAITGFVIGFDDGRRVIGFDEGRAVGGIDGPRVTGALLGISVGVRTGCLDGILVGISVELIKG